jgi:hypothetical protein
MCEFSKIREIENNRVELDLDESWKSLGAQLHCVNGEGGIHVTEVIWVNDQNQKITIVHTTYRINNNKVIHYGFSSPKHFRSPPKFWGENIDFILHYKIGEKLKEIFDIFIKKNEIVLPKYDKLLDNFANWRESRNDDVPIIVKPKNHAKNKKVIEISRDFFGTEIGTSVKCKA